MRCPAIPTLRAIPPDDDEDDRGTPAFGRKALHELLARREEATARFHRMKDGLLGRARAPGALPSKP